MGIFDRIWRVIRSNINYLIDKAEDPEKMLEQIVIELQDEMVQMRQAVAQSIAIQKRLERQANQAELSATEWHKKAQMALQHGQESLAREALSRRKPYQETAVVFKQQLGQQAEIVTRLKQDMRLLEGKLAEAKTKKEMYIARARSAQASQRMNEMLGNIGTGTARAAFDRMEEKVLDMEARSEAIAELSQNTLEGKFAALEATSVDDDLAALKAELGAAPELPELPPNADSASS